MLKAFTALCTIMALSSDWYRAQGYRQMGVDNLEDFLVMAEGFFSSWVPMNLYHQTLTWMAADISAQPRFNGDLGAALRSIRARALIMPCDTDMYFSVADNEAEVAQMPNAELKVIHSMWGHVMCMPGISPQDDAFVDAEVRKLLDSPV